MVRTYKALSALLTYPTAELQDAAPDIRAVLQDEGLVPRAARAALDRLVADMATADLYELQERYTHLFDRSRSLSLHLFEHVHGESRDRGQAMVDLAQHYAAHGYRIAAKELPDFLPLFLEFLSRLDAAAAHDLLQQPLPILAALGQRLRARGSAYAAVLDALVAIAGGRAVPAELVVDDDPLPDDLDALDQDWAEAAVSFGPGAGDDACGKGRIATRIRAALRSAHDRSA